MNAQELLRLADDELILGWRNSEWTGIAPFLEEDVAFSSIAQTEIGHARAWYELAAKELGTDADSLAFDREPDEYLCAAARRDAHGGRLGADDRPPLALRDRRPRSGSVLLNIDRPGGRGPRGEDRPRGDLPPHARRDVGRAAPRRARAFARPSTSSGRMRSASSPRSNGHSSARRSNGTRSRRSRQRTDGTTFGRFWEEMTMVRRSVPGATW